LQFPVHSFFFKPVCTLSLSYFVEFGNGFLKRFPEVFVLSDKFAPESCQLFGRMSPPVYEKIITQKIFIVYVLLHSHSFLSKTGKCGPKDVFKEY